MRDITIHVFAVKGVPHIRTAPQVAHVRNGVCWTVVNHIDGSPMTPVSIDWDGEPPCGADCLTGHGEIRAQLGAAPHGRYKYTVSAAGAVEDPEIEIDGM